MLSTVHPAEGGVVIESDGHREKRAPVLFCCAPRWSAAEAAAGLQGGMQGMRAVVSDAEYLPQHPFLRHLHQRLQFHSQDRTCSPDEFAESVVIGCLHPAAPAHYIVKHRCQTEP